MMKDVNTLKFVCNQLCKALDACREGKHLASPDVVITTINNSDTELAKQLVAKYNIV